MSEKRRMIHTNEAAGALNCLRKVVLIRHQNGAVDDFALPDGHEFRRRLEELFENDPLPCGQKGDSSERSFDILRHHDKARNLRFESRGIRTTIPVLEFDREGSIEQGKPLWIVWYPVYGTNPKDTMLHRLYADCAVLAANGIDVSSIRFICLRSDLISDPDLKADEIFTVYDHLRKPRGGFRKPTAIEMVRDLEQKEPFGKFLNLAAEALDQALDLSLDEIAVRKTKLCSSAHCPFYEECYQKRTLPNDSVALLSSCAAAGQMMEKGIVTLDQVPGEAVEGSPFQYAQIMAARNPKGYFLDAGGVEEWFSKLTFPLSYLDFEWDTYVLSPYAGMRPFDVLCFQYSLHVETREGKLSHTAFFETGDCREAFIRSLLRDLPKTGSILVFNMEGAEKLRLRQLAEQFPEYREQLESVCERMIDLALPFESGCFYNLAQRSHSSLKTLLPLFAQDVSYHDLDVSNGVQAVNVYRQAQNERGLQQLQLARDISEYCSLDTLAEKKLADGLKQKLEEEECQI